MGNNQWVLPSFKQILIDASDEYVANTDKSKDKPRTALIARVADEIRGRTTQLGEACPGNWRRPSRLSSLGGSSSAQRGGGLRFGPGRQRGFLFCVRRLAAFSQST